MAIQFSCRGCEQPIEVDDAYAGKAALCPYCRTEVTVPSASTYTPAKIVARPMSSPLAAGGLGGARLDAARAAALSSDMPEPVRNPFATWAISCTALFVAATLVVLSIAMPIMIKHIPPGKTTFSAQEQEAISMAAMEEMGQDGVLRWAAPIAMFSAVAGFSLAIAALARRGAPVRSWVSLVICGLPALCTVLGFLSKLAGAGKT